MNKLIHTVVFLPLILAPQASATSEGATLERARKLFAQIDVDADQYLSAVEAGRSKISSRDFVTSDYDRDRRLSPDEFLLFFRELAIKGGLEVDADYEEVAIKVRASLEVRRKEAEEARKERERAAHARQEAQNAEVRKRIQSQREDPRIQDSRRRAIKRRVKAGTDRIVDVREDLQGPDGGRRSGKPSLKESQQIILQEQQLVDERAAAELAAEAGANAARTGNHTPAEVDTIRKRVQAEESERLRRERELAMSPESVSKLYVQRMQELGHLTAKDAKDLFLILGDEDRTQPLDPAVARGVLARLRPRIADLVREGMLTAEPGRVLSNALDARLKAAVQGSSDEEIPQRTRRTRKADSEFPKMVPPPKPEVQRVKATKTVRRGVSGGN